MSMVEHTEDTDFAGHGLNTTDGAGMIPGAAQARLVLALVVVFTVAFVAVIMMKLERERQGVAARAQIAYAQDASTLAQDVGARLALARGALSGAAAAAEIDARDGDGADIADHLVALAARRDVSHAAIADPAGTVRLVTDAAMAGVFADALAQRQGLATWTAPDPDGSGALYMAVEITLPGAARILVARLNAEALTPRETGLTLALTDGDGRLMTRAGGFEALDLALLAARARTEGAAVEDLGPAGGDDRNAAAVTPVGATGAYLAYVGLMRENMAQWRRTLAFYLLLLLAPVLVAVGLCAVLLMQMDNVRQTRHALYDSERRFRLAVEGARCGVWDWDLNKQEVFITESLARMLGRRRAATLPTDEFLGLIRREDQDKIRSALRSAAATGEVDVEFRAVGLPMSLHARGRPWAEISGEPTGRVVGVAIDVTEQRGAQQRVLKAETQMRQALESMTESFVLWDSRRRLVTANAKFREFFHLDQKLVKRGASYEMLEMAARDAIKAYHPGSRADVSELELVDGRWITLSERDTADGGTVSIGSDITALKRSEAQLKENERHLRNTVTELSIAEERLTELAQQAEESRMRAEDANRSKSEFLANMSHELRTPLNAINGFSEIMQQEMFGPLGDERYKEYIGDILSSGQLLLQLINDILDMSKIEAGKMKLAYERVFPDEIAEQCVRLVRGRAKEAGLELLLNVEDMPEISADPRALKQILLNLLSNAIKFTPRDGKVEMRGGADDTGVSIQVIDTGVGIAQKDLDRIGKPFEQIESQLAKTHQGSGLGLALCKSLAEMHHGSITIDSEVGVGTVVTLWIPRSPPAELELDDAE